MSKTIQMPKLDRACDLKPAVLLDLPGDTPAVLPGLPGKTTTILSTHARLDPMGGCSEYRCRCA